MTLTTDARSVLSGGGDIDELRERLTDGAGRLAGARGSILAHPRLLLISSAVLMTGGLTAIVLGWVGAARTTHVEQQVPYLISGGLLGVALSTIGALLFFSHWLTAAVHWLAASVTEARQHEAARQADHEELVRVLRSASRERDDGAPSGPTGRRRAPRST